MGRQRGEKDNNYYIVNKYLLCLMYRYVHSDFDFVKDRHGKLAYLRRGFVFYIEENIAST